jgi:hypothetical protein
MMDTSLNTADSPRRFKVASPGLKSRAGNTGADLSRIVGIGPLTRVKTSFGEFPAQALRERDRVMVRGGAYLPIKSVKRATFDEDFIRYHPGAQPVVIRAGALGHGLPAIDVTLAPFQKLSKNQTFIRPGKDTAVALLGRPQVYRKPEKIITYTMIDLGRPAEILCEGIWVNV